MEFFEFTWSKYGCLFLRFMKVNIIKSSNNSKSISLCISNAMADLETPFDKMHIKVFLSTIFVCYSGKKKNTILQHESVPIFLALITKMTNRRQNEIHNRIKVPEKMESETHCEC